MENGKLVVEVLGSSPKSLEMPLNVRNHDETAGQSISVIVPVYNESAGVGGLLRFLSPLREQCEIIFVDGGSSDDTAKTIGDRGFTVVSSPQKGRAYQMNHGASLSGGDILWFLHADSLPPDGALTHIRDVLGSGYEIGCFPMRFDSIHPLLLIISFLSNNLRTRKRNIAFGDQGIFLQRWLFEEVGGYAAIPLFEDYQLSLDITKNGLKFGMAKKKITTSARRYREHGRTRTMLRMWWLQIRFTRGDDIEEIARAYIGDR